MTRAVAERAVLTLDRLDVTELDHMNRHLFV